MLVDQLPPHSRYAEARANDREIALRLLEQDLPQRPRGPRVSEWTPELAALTSIQSSLSAVWAQLVALRSGKNPPTIPDPPKPFTAFDMVRHERRLAHHRSVVDEVREAQRRFEESHPGR